MSIKAIFFDIDGTLLSHKSKRVPEDTRKAFEQLKAKGIKLFASTDCRFGIWSLMDMCF